ncbi:unnamed protein product [Calicophoron daubneyi]|uniref:Glutamine amidotransferase type-2 domain-containing protein n=1 Tax=Calicophoron daubneyi TaxID=300641 RepID=A0AAV2TI17_CALDB
MKKNKQRGEQGLGGFESFPVVEVGLISPPPHHDIYSIEDLAQLIYDLRAANPLATISVKLVSEVGVGVIAAGVAKARAAHITISGHGGGTGASSWTGIKHAGLPWELGIAETHQILVSQHIRGRVILQADGQIRTACRNMDTTQLLHDPMTDKAACGVGFVVNTKGNRSNQILQEAKIMLKRMDHRGACACDENTGDGAGVMTAIPHELYTQFAREAKVELPPLGQFATGLIFVHVQRATVESSIRMISDLASECGLRILFWRMADVHHEVIGEVASAQEPAIVHVFIVREAEDEKNQTDSFRRQVYLLRKYASHQLRDTCYICSLSPDTVVYKGMFTTTQLWSYYEDLKNPAYSTHFAMVHNRFSTNTLPSWDRAHPQRMLAHNGEINTLRGNVNYCRARQSRMKSQYFADHLLSKLFPVIEADMSDSGSFDNLLEFLYEAGEYSLPEAIMMMIPEAWHNQDPTTSDMPLARWNFYKWAANNLEPWDGPALVAFSDGRYVGAVLDRNGLRPARYYATSNDMVYLSSEVGVVDIPPDVRIIRKGRLRAGRLVIVDTKAGDLLNDEILKEEIVSKHPYGEWLEMGAMDLNRLHTIISEKEIERNNSETCAKDPVFDDRRLPLFGYNPENISMLLLPMLKTDKEALGSMGNDAPLACLSEHSPHVFDYFQQLFAQVTNPPIDPFRERVVMTLSCPIGPQQNILIPAPEQTRRLWLTNPILSLSDVKLLRSMDGSFVKFVDPKQSNCHVLSWRTVILDATFDCWEPSSQGRSLGSLLHAALEKISTEAEEAIRDGRAQLLIITDRSAGPTRIPIPSLLALGAVHQHLLRKQLRMQTALIVESGEAKEVHHFCTLIGFGADAICPYILFECVARMDKSGILNDPQSISQVHKNLTGAVKRGIFKVMAKMGISTLHSYKSAQVFEAVGLAQCVVDMCFLGAASRIGGADFEILAEEARARHLLAYPQSLGILNTNGMNHFSYNPGFYHWRCGGEYHMNDPKTIANLQAASRSNSRDVYRAFTESADWSSQHCTLRGQLDINFAEEPIPLDSVEPASEIVKHFSTGAMSLGSISSEAHTALARAMNRIGARSNTGEGGERPERYLNEELRSSIKQVASARFGVNSSYLAHADTLQIKMAQGAKPGEGGELPGYKVTEEIAKVRYSVPGVGLISPPPHHDIYSIEDLAQLIYDLRAANPLATISVKLVSEVGVGVIAAGVAKARAAHITISGHDGGTGASSWTGIKHAGLPWELGIAETHQILVSQHIRGRVILQADGQIRTGRDVIIATLLGADEFAMSTAPLLVLGCTMMRKCHLNTCPVGIATQDPILRAKFKGCPEHVINYLFLLAEEVREYMSKLGFRRLQDMVGHTEYLKPLKPPLNAKAAKLDLHRLLEKAKPMPIFPHWVDEIIEDESSASLEDQSPVEQLLHHLPPDRHLDIDLLKAAKHLIETPAEAALGEKSTVHYTGTIRNVDRAFGATLSYAISMQFVEDGLPMGREVNVSLTGSAGQSFCAFLARGVRVRLEGDANDYVAKGLSGGHVTIVPPKEMLDAGYKSEDNLLVGNVCLYGATSGRLFLRGQAAERFCVRNSGATVVVEGVGDHGCEYMTGGRAVILGHTGRNFAAGMSGGLAFVYDPLGVRGPFARKCNMELVDLESMSVDNEYSSWLESIIREFTNETGSSVGARLLAHWDSVLENFLIVFPREYRKALEKLKSQQSNQIVLDDANKNHISEPVNKPHKVTVDIEDMASGDPTGKTEELDKVRGFIKYARNDIHYRSAEERSNDWSEVHAHDEVRKGLRRQAARCMDCGVPFCQSFSGCPLGNLIPDWNNLMFKEDWQAAYLALAQTNNFPEFTGRVCPAPCEGACVLGIDAEPVTIKHIECAIADKAWEYGYIQPIGKAKQGSTGRRVAVIGSGPAGLACADQLSKIGYAVTVIERRNKPGGLLRYGIPTMKLDRKVLDRRLDMMRENGVQFLVNTRVGHVGDKDSQRDLNDECREDGETVTELRAAQLLDDFDAVVLCLGATWPRDLNIPGRHLDGIYFAMSFLERWQRRQNGRPGSSTGTISEEDGIAMLAKNKRVVILGGGDTGTDCVATSLRQGAKSIQTLEILPPPPPKRDPIENPWPEWPRVWRTDYGHSEVAVRFGRDPRRFSVITKKFLDNGSGAVGGLLIAKVEWKKNPDDGRWMMNEVPDSEETIECDLVLLALGFLGPESKLIEEFALNVTNPQSVIQTKAPGSYATSVHRVYAAGDCRRGQSLVVHAINEGRLAAREVDQDLMGCTQLPISGGVVKLPAALTNA